MAQIMTDGAVLEVPSKVAFSEDLESSDVRVYMALAWFTRAGHTFPTQAAIADLAQVHKNTAAMALARLVNVGLVTVDKTRSPFYYQLAA